MLGLRFQRTFCTALLALSGIACGPQRALAHGAPLDRPVGWQDWNWDPVILLNLVLILWLYRRGWQRLQPRQLKSSGGGAETARQRLVAPWRAVVFAASIGVLALALISPLDLLGEQLGWAHMVQHMLLMTVAAPLLMLAAPGLICWCGLTPVSRRLFLQTRRALGSRPRRWLWSPLVAWSLYAVATWVWHLPALYQAALRDPWMHDLQHLTFFISACLFWRVLLDPLARQKLAGGLAVLYLFTTTLHATVLGVFMALAPVAWYPDYERTTHWWGLTALEDQQIAGLIMWMPACATYLVVAIALFANALGERAGELPQPLLHGMVTQ